MKILKFSLLSFVLVCLVAMGSAFSTRTLATVNYQFNSTFTVGDNSGPIDDDIYWDLVAAVLGCEDADKFCALVVTTVPGQSMPSKQVILSHAKTKYENNGNTFSHQEEFDIFVNGVKVAVGRIMLKS